MKVNKCDVIQDTNLQKFKDRVEGFITYKTDVSVSMSTYPDILGIKYAALIVWTEEIE
jgi:hypothetical protein